MIWLLHKMQVHTKIWEHATKTGIFNPRNHDSVLNKIVKLIKHHHEGTLEMIQLKQQILAFEFPEGDKQWDVSISMQL